MNDFENKYLSSDDFDEKPFSEPKMDFEDSKTRSESLEQIVNVQPIYMPESAIIPETTVTSEEKFEPKESFYRETIKNETKEKDKSKFKRAIAIACVASILGGSFLGTGLAIGTSIARNVIIPKMTGNYQNVEANLQKDSGFTFESNIAPVTAYTGGSDVSKMFVDVIKRIEPSIVAITSQVKVNSNNFFYNEGTQPGSGSGIIFKEDAEKVFIATNYHVISGAVEVGVSVGEKELVQAKLVGREPLSDLAVISIEKADLKNVGVDSVTVAPFGDSDATDVGEMVVAIGNALGSGNNTITLGTISVKDKTVGEGDQRLTVIQTDAAINPGNSGGALVNSRGEVIGINTAKTASAGLFSSIPVEGMGYSITSNTAKPIIENLMVKKSTAFLGVQGENITEQFVEQYNLLGIGVIVKYVVEDSGAFDAGLLRGDIITGFNGKTVMNWDQLSSAIKECKVGDEVEVKFYRNGNTPMTSKVKLKEYIDTNF